jgi:hypothetical protein
MPSGMINDSLGVLALAGQSIFWATLVVFHRKVGYSMDLVQRSVGLKSLGAHGYEIMVIVVAGTASVVSGTAAIVKLILSFQG